MHHKVIIIGAGPAGLQTAYFLKKFGIDYLILERNKEPGSFFTNLPISGKLISLNKVYTGTEDSNINLRYDWNSLLNDEGLLFKQFSEEFYPHVDSLKEYLFEFSKGLNIKYGYSINSVDKNENGFSINDLDYTCTKLIVASGLTPLKTIHPHYGILGRKYFDDKEKFKNKTVLIIGSGNSGFELANLLTPYASSILLFGRSINLAANTHYAGHLRTNYLSFIDTGMLKLQNFMYIDSKNKNFSDSDFKYENGKYQYTFEKGPISLKEFDYLFMCNGFEFDDSIFRFPIDRISSKKCIGDMEERGKFPLINEVYESINNHNLYFAGSLMHGLDFGKSPGGFIHGFRYSIKYMITTIFSKNREFTFYSINHVVELAFNRLTSESGLIVMFDQFCDYIEKDGDRYIYIPFVNKQWVAKNGKGKYITLSYKFGTSLFDVFKDCRGRNDDDEDVPGFIHPVITTYKLDKTIKNEYHCYEDDILNFTKPIHKKKLRECVLSAFE